MKLFIALGTFVVGMGLSRFLLGIQTEASPFIWTIVSISVLLDHD